MHIGYCVHVYITLCYCEHYICIQQQSCQTWGGILNSIYRYNRVQLKFDRMILDLTYKINCRTELESIVMLLFYTD